MRFPKSISIILIVIIVLSTCNFSKLVNADSEYDDGPGELFYFIQFFAGGDGSPGNPFQISNLTELQNMSANLSAHYVLINDIDASSTITWNWNGSAYNGFIPVANDTDPGTSGFQGINFSGSLDGRGYNITNLFMNYTTDDYIGLFGRTNAAAVIKNVSLINYTIFGDYYVASLIGYNNGGSVSNANSSGTINVPGLDWSDTHYLGGLTGFNNGLVTHCITWGDINNTGENAGGIAGWNDGLVTNCISYVNVTGYIDGGGSKGGLIGYNEKGIVKNCTAYGDVTGYYDVGGLIGTSDKTTINCTAYGNVMGGLQFGGLIGISLGPVSDSRAYGNVYSSGIGSEYSVGGLIGASGGKVTNCNSYGDIFGNQDVGGLIGLNDAPVINSTSYGNTTGLYGDSWAVGGLIGENYGITITDCNAYGITYASVDVGGLIGYNEGGTIKNCYTYASTTGYWDVGGLIGYNDGDVMNSTVHGSVKGMDLYTGGVIGQNYGVITNCISYNFTNGTYDAGGIIGWHLEGTVSNCTAYGDVNGTYDIGGLVGYNLATVTNSTAYGDINGEYDIGGLIGNSNSDSVVINCTASGNVTATIGYTWNIGGLMGENHGSIDGCDAYGDVYGNSEFIGGLVGYSDGPAIDCHAYGNVNGSTADFVGGLIGENIGWVIDSTAAGDVIGTNYVGGLIGESSFTIINTSASGNISGNKYVGGLIGYNMWDVTDSQAYGSTNIISTEGDYAGGLIGYNEEWGLISGSSAFGDVNGSRIYSDNVGGLIGFNSYEITNCTSFGNTTGNNNVGGLVGNNSGSINYSSSYGVTEGNDTVGGLVGYNSGTLEYCTSYGNTSGKNHVGGLAGRNVGTIDNCTAYGNTTATGSDFIGGLIGSNYGQVTKSNAYGNTNGSDYIGGLIGKNDGGNVQDSESFGNTNGNRNVGGLIGYNGGIINNCTTKVNVTGIKSFSENIGGLVGYNTGTVTNSTSFGMTAGNNSIGGIVGKNDGGSIYYSHSTGNVTANANYAGGLAGFNSGNVNDSYSLSNVSGNDSIGGFVGTNSAGNIDNCYSAGYVNGTSNMGGFSGSNTGTITDSFWDNITTGQSSSSGGSGRNTTEMMKRSTFFNAGWDFVDIWAIKEGTMYPFFGFRLAPPKILNGTLAPATENQFYSVMIVAEYSKVFAANKLTWDLITNASGWLSFDGNGTISGTPVNDDVGTYWVNVTVTDIFGKYDTRNFTLTVYNENDPPQFTSSPILTAEEDVLYYYDVNASDIDKNDILTYILTTSPVNMTINANTGEITWTPTNEQVGVHNVTVKVIDIAGDNDTQQFSVTVSNVNDVPQITSTPVTNATEDQLYTYDVEAEDVDAGDVLTYNMTTAPANMTINETTGLITWTPTKDQVGIHDVVVNVTDLAGANASQSFKITVKKLNSAPKITSIAKTTAMEDALYTYDVEATDVDIGDVLTFSLIQKPENMTIDSASGGITWTPVNEQVGVHDVKVEVKDKAGENDTQTFKITVSNTNDAPVITSSAINTATEEVLYTYDVEALDVDVGDTLTYSLTSNPAGMVINSATGLISWTPTNAQVGINSVVVRVQDLATAFVTQPFIITVANVNDAPEITSAALTTATEDLQYSYDVDATDVDAGDVLTFTLVTKPEGMAINDATGQITWTPTNAQVGNHDVKVMVEDQAGENDTQSFSITVDNANDAPEITSTAVLTATEDEFYVYYVLAVDIDAGDSLTFSLTTKPAGMAIDSATGVIGWTPTNDQVGSHNVVVKVVDQSSEYATQSYTVTVSNVNDAPVIVTDNKLSAKEGESYFVDYNATDIDPTADTLKWSLETNASTWLSINTDTGVLSGTPGDGDAGSYRVKVIVSDGKGGSDFKEFILKVYPKPKPPVKNLAPVITTDDVTTATVGKTYYVDYNATDDRTPAKDLKWSYSSNASWLSFNIDTGVLTGTPGEGDTGPFWIKIKVGDDDGAFAYRNFTITVTAPYVPPEPKNKPPELSEGKMTPVAGNEDTEFTFSVHYSDEDSDPPDPIKVVIDGHEHDMTLSEGQNASDGDYEYKTKLGVGKHSYYFKANDGKDDAVSGDKTTPTVLEDAEDTPVITKVEPKEKKEEGTNWLLYIIPIIVAIIVILLYFIFMRRKPKVEEEMEVVTEEEIEDETPQIPL